MLVAARARRRPASWLLPALGIALAFAFAGAVAVDGVIAGDQAAHAQLGALSELDRTVRVSWQGALTPAVDRRARALLSGLRLGRQTQVVLLNPVRLSGVIVRPAAISPLEAWMPPAAVGKLGPCRAGSCPMLQAAGGPVGPVLAAAGVRIDVAAQGPLRSAAPLAFETASEGQWPLLISGDTAGLDALPGLSGVYRVHSWLAILPAARLHSWQLAAVQARLARAQATLLQTGSQWSFSAPFDALQQAQAQAQAAPRQLALVGGAALAALALFIALSAGALRREQQAELQRLRGAGASSGQLLAFVAGEGGLLSAFALLAGAALGLLSAVVLASGAREPAGAVLAHSLLSARGALALAVAWLLSTGLLSVPAFASRGGRPFGALALPAAGRGPVLARLALSGLAREPALPALTAAFVAISVGLGGFTLAYRATLNRSAADQAANQVPLDALLSASASFQTPLALAPLGRWRALVPGGTVLAVRRTLASFASGEGYTTVPALGIPASGLTLIHGWRAGDGSASLATLARRLQPPGPIRVPGPLVPPGANTLALTATSPGIAVELTADLRSADGTITQLPLGSAGAGGAGSDNGHLRARLPSGRWELEALELDEPAGVQVTNAHQNGENAAAATQFAARVRLGPLQFLGANGQRLVTVDLSDWRAVGAAAALPAAARLASAVQQRPQPAAALPRLAANRSRPSAPPALLVSFQASGAPGIVRPAQPSDARALPVLADPQTAAAAGPGGGLALTLDGLPIIARVVGVIRRFPTIAPGSAGVVVADQARLAAALDAQLPGQGQADELWIETAHLARLRAALRDRPLASLAAGFRAGLARGLRDAPVARSVVRALLAATLLSGALALLGLLTALRGALRDAQLRADLQALGLGPRALCAELRVRLACVSLTGALAGLAIALLLTRSVVGVLGDAGALSQPQPPLVTIVPPLGLAVWVLGAVAILMVAGWLASIERVP